MLRQFGAHLLGELEFPVTPMFLISVAPAASHSEMLYFRAREAALCVGRGGGASVGDELISGSYLSRRVMLPTTNDRGTPFPSGFARIATSPNTRR